MREPLAGFEVLLLERRVQDAQPPYLAGRGHFVARQVGFTLAVGGLEGRGAGSLHGQHRRNQHWLKTGGSASSVNLEVWAGCWLGLEAGNLTSFLWCRHS